MSELQSYDTRLWFVVLFIPVIPLTRKRIIDECSYCRKHYVVNAAAYEQSRQLQIAESLEGYHHNPSPESALGTHALILDFRDFRQARTFREDVLADYPDDASLLSTLATQLDHYGAYEEASPLYEAALEIQPDLEEAREGVASRRMVQGELDEARRLLSFLEAPGAGQFHSLASLERLARRYQVAEDHESALELAEVLQRERPEVAHRGEFRAMVKKSEKAVMREETILPPVAGSIRQMFRGDESAYTSRTRNGIWLAVGAGLLATGLFASNEYIRQNRTLHVVNACGPPVQVRVDGGEPVSIAGLGQITLAEGRHEIQLSGPVEESIGLDVQADFMDRWFKKPAWIINAGGEAVLDELTIHYAQNPQPATHNLLTGQPVVSLPHVDYLFETPPQSLKLKRKNDEQIRLAVSWVMDQDEDVFQELLNTNRPAAYTFIERRLKRTPGNADLIEVYLASPNPEDVPRIEEFLKAGLDRKPPSVEWHRGYQSVAEFNNHGDSLIPLYDQFVASDPQNGAYLYLRGRIDPDTVRRAEFYQKAIDADPDLPWPWLAKAAMAADEARWQDCKQALDRAIALKIGSDQLRMLPHLAAMGLGNADALVKHYQDQMETDPRNLSLILQLMDALAAAGQSDKILAEAIGWQSRSQHQLGNELVTMVRAIGYYMMGKPEEAEKLCEATPSLTASSIRLHSLFAMRKGREVAANPLFAEALGEPWKALALSLVLGLEGEPALADEWRAKAIAAFPQIGPNGKSVANLLAAAEPPELKQITSLSIEPDDKALLLASLAQKFPARRQEYLAAAAKYNILHSPPHLLLNLALETKIAVTPEAP